VIHAAAMSATEEVFRDPERGRAINVGGTDALAGWCRDHRRRLIFTSTDLVFDGSRGWYREEDEVSPIAEYGRTKAAAEQLVLGLAGGVVARLSLLFGPSLSAHDSFFDRAVAALRGGQPAVFFDDEYRTPLDYATAARALVGLAQVDFQGIVHVAGRERMSRHELMTRAASVLGLDPALVRANRKADLTLPEPRPTDVSLVTSRLDRLLPELDRPSIERAVTAMLAV
jgi:dTDP-4-dehydrorhamnose reductase